MTDRTPWTVILDANIWIGERMLHSPLGAALLYALVQDSGRIALPEIVRREVDMVLLREFDRTIDGMEKSVRWLRQLTDRHVSVTLPSRAAAEAGFDARWAQLAGALDGIPLTLAHAQRALNKVLQKAPPSGSNNEQFRDCCIWEVALELSETRSVHLVSSDNNFYNGRSIGGGMASSLTAELKLLGRELFLHPTLDAFLSSRGLSAMSADEEAIKAAIVSAVTPKAEELAVEEGREFAVSPPTRIDINGYATPEASAIAVAFGIHFRLSQTGPSYDAQPLVKLRLTMGGSLSWDPVARQLADWQLSGWSKSLEEPGRGFQGSSWEPGLAADFEPGQFRMI